ncbi:Neopullulanase 1 precursor [Kluyvera cryocrescens]|uniref:Neopullulanase 1 n=1 Tax=Kluyvera cryocrescens TaxID=580 RepID=A0A485D2J7_KLUCR|nr:Neopullulanase 1 precursor [Kluyvera cryocrescens]
MGKRWTGWGYASLPKLDYRSDALVQEIYGGEDSIVRHWLKAPWNMDGWRLDVVHMLGEAGGAKNNLKHVAGITQAAKAERPDAYVLGEHFGDARQWLQQDAEDAAMNYRGFTFPLWGFSSQYRYLLRSAKNRRPDLRSLDGRVSCWAVAPAAATDV